MKKLLETKRLILRRFTQEDVQNIYDLHNDVDVMKYIPHPEPLNVPMENCQKFIDHFIKKYEDGTGLSLYAADLKDTGEFIGWVEIAPLDDTDDVEVGYRFAKKYWGNGYATEAAIALVDYGFNTLGLKKLTGVTMLQNIASQKVLKKSGMKYVEDRKYYGVMTAYFEIFKP